MLCCLTDGSTPERQLYTWQLRTRDQDQVLTLRLETDQMPKAQELANAAAEINLANHSSFPSPQNMLKAWGRGWRWREKGGQALVRAVSHSARHLLLICVHHSYCSTVSYPHFLYWVQFVWFVWLSTCFAHWSALVFWCGTAEGQHFYFLVKFKVCFNTSRSDALWDTVHHFVCLSRH